MNCPHCNTEMKDKSYMYYGFGEWDADYPMSEHKEFICPNCKIKYIQGDWIVPKSIELASKKQINCVNVINTILYTDYVPLTKQGCYKFIKENMIRSKKESQMEQESNSNPEDLDFYENDIWCEHY